MLLAKKEETVVTWIKECQRKRFQRTKCDLKYSVKEYLDKNPNMPEKGWCYAFLKRHSDISTYTPVAITTVSSNVSESDSKDNFNKIETYVIIIIMIFLWIQRVYTTVMK